MSNKSIVFPRWLRQPVENAARAFFEGGGGHHVDFSVPPGEQALCRPYSISWRVFKNPVSLFIGGVAAVILELGEPRVRTGVWEHSGFRTDPALRLRRTGLAAMVTVYGAKSVAEAMISGINRQHGKVAGITPGGVAYAANDPELLNWVHATAAFGFLCAYTSYVEPLSMHERDRYYCEGAAAGLLYGAIGTPRSTAALDAYFAAMAPRLEKSAIVHDFLGIMKTAPVLPAPMRPLQRILVKAAVTITPNFARQRLGLGREWELRSWEAALVKHVAAIANRLVLDEVPAVQACRRLGLAANFLYR